MLDEMTLLGRLYYCIILPIIVSVGALTATGAIAWIESIFGVLLGCILVAIAIIDARRHVIPNVLTAAAVVLGLLRVAAADGELSDFVSALAKAAAVTVPLVLLLLGYRRWRHRDGLGWGDIKLAAVAGIWLDWITILIVVEAATLAALTVYVVNSRLKQRPLKATAFLPFGAFLAPAIWLGWLAEMLLN
jgi:leader peptidase (prepilin peptidase) / N-methyltransferase